MKVTQRAIDFWRSIGLMKPSAISRSNAGSFREPLVFVGAGLAAYLFMLGLMPRDQLKPVVRCSLHDCSSISVKTVIFLTIYASHYESKFRANLF